MVLTQHLEQSLLSPAGQPARQPVAGTECRTMEAALAQAYKASMNILKGRHNICCSIRHNTHGLKSSKLRSDTENKRAKKTEWPRSHRKSGNTRHRYTGYCRPTFPIPHFLDNTGTTTVCINCICSISTKKST